MQITKSFLLYLLLILISSPLFGVNEKKLGSSNYKYTLAITSIFKDEAPYMQEWIEYYKLLGVDHFRLYNNDSEDNYLEVLEPYIQSGEVTLIDWPSDLTRLGPNEEWVWSTQHPACMDAIKCLSGKAKWLALIDLDEFILPFYYSDIPTFLKAYEDCSGVVINWCNFGTSHVVDIPPGQLLIETLTWRSNQISDVNKPVKSIVQPHKIDIKTKKWSPHTWPYLNDKEDFLSPNREVWHFGLIETSLARINHYVHRTEKNYYEQKIPKTERMRGSKLSKRYIDEWKDSCNQIEDTEILRFVPTLKDKIFPKKEAFIEEPELGDPLFEEESGSEEIKRGN